MIVKMTCLVTHLTIYIQSWTKYLKYTKQGWKYEGRRECSAPNFLFAPLALIATFLQQNTLSNKKGWDLPNTNTKQAFDSYVTFLWYEF